MKFRKRIHVYLTDDHIESLKRHVPDLSPEEAVQKVLDYIADARNVEDEIVAELAELRAKEADA